MAARRLLVTTRRAFLKTTLHGSSLIALAPSVPGFLARTARAAQAQPDGRSLVVIELSGGNDGINTVVPYQDEGYAKHRKALRLLTKDLLKVNDQIGLNPSMGDAAKLLESGRLAIVQGVGYPNPNRSHFQSMAIWQTARFDPEEHKVAGWLGRGLDGLAGAAPGAPSALYVGSGSPPVALRGRRAVAAAVERLEDFALDVGAESGRLLAEGQGTDDLAAFVRRSTLDAYATADHMAALGRAPEKGTPYPGSTLAGHLRLVARLLKAGFGARVFYTSQPGYDTHIEQLATHPYLLSELSGALRAFLDDLAAAGLAERVVVLCFSEFGRRVAENGTGTDHGTAGPVFLAGTRVQSGLVANTPRLLDLEDGDLKMGVDFRRVYATVLEGWLGLPARAALGGAFEPLPLFRS
jgi:uncharacterized protein (DUF1501 family)